MQFLGWLISFSSLFLIQTAIPFYFLNSQTFNCKMGQQCCSQQFVNKQSYNNVQHSFLDKPSIQIVKPQTRLDTRYDTAQMINPFQPFEKQPYIHPTVQQIQKKLGSFKHSSLFEPQEGIKKNKAYAINSEGLIYDAGGEWKDGLPHGFGKLVYQDGSIYTGYFEKGVPHGEGRFISSQGWYYEGDIEKEQAEGSGFFEYENLGYRYQGLWGADFPNGRGKQTWVKLGKTSSYEGQFIKGKKHGAGRYICGDEWEYQGDFSNNQITSSKGRIKYKNGESYIGDFKNGKKDGFGVYKWADGSVFQGWYVDDKKQGHGKFRTADNKLFQGQWKNGKREGKGTLLIDGKIHPGVWHNDQLSSKTQI